MAVLLTATDIGALATDVVALKAARAAVKSEATGRTRLPARIDVPSEHGFLRVMPAVMGDRMGVKVMTLAEGIGTRYLLALYEVATGELLALYDADELTRLRTAATTAVAAEAMVVDPPTSLAIVGSGFEAEGHLRMLAGCWPLDRVRVYSRRPENRSAFAAEMSAELGIAVDAAPSLADALAGQPVVVLATKNVEPVVNGELFAPGTVVLSIGSTRPELRELDTATMARSATLVVDDRAQVRAESGDIIAGFVAGLLSDDRVRTVAELHDVGLVPCSEHRDLQVFKSVGTALQDLALAEAIYGLAVAEGLGRELGAVASLKPFAGKPTTR